MLLLLNHSEAARSIESHFVDESIFALARIRNCERTSQDDPSHLTKGLNKRYSSSASGFLRIRKHRRTIPAESPLPGLRSILLAFTKLREGMRRTKENGE